MLRHRLRRRLHRWKARGASRQVQGWIRSGVNLEEQWGPKGRPRPFNQGISLTELDPEEQAFLDKEISRLFASGAWEEAVSDQFVSKAFLVPKKSDVEGVRKFRLIIDLRHLNEHCRDYTVRYETLGTLTRWQIKDSWAFSWDLRDGYHAVGVRPQDRKYFTMNLQGRLIQIAVLPFGWSGSCTVFCKTMETFVSTLRSPGLGAGPKAVALSTARQLQPLVVGGRRVKRWGPPEHCPAPPLQILPFMDDFLVVCPTRAECLLARSQVQLVLEDLGIERHPEKGCWEPKQRFEHLGIDLDFKEGQFRAPERRLLQLRQMATSMIGRSLRSRRLLPARLLAKFTGLAQFLYLAIPVARFYLRSLHDVLRTKSSWDSNVRLSKQALRDLEWWKTVPVKWTGREMQRSPSTVHLHTDASTFAWGGVLNYDEGRPAQGCWTSAEARYHITALELLAVHKSVLTFLPQLRGSRVTLHEDSQAIVFVLREKTSRSPVLMRLLRRLWKVLDLHSISLEVVWVRSADNISDGPSRMRDYEDWSFDRRAFQFFHRAYKYTVDLFASDVTALLPRFCSRSLCPGSLRADAFSWAWAGERAWVNPPWEELPRVVQMLEVTPAAAATVVVPWWPSAGWFSRLLALASDWEMLPVSNDLILRPNQHVRRLVGSATRFLGVFHVRLR